MCDRTTNRTEDFWENAGTGSRPSVVTAGDRPTWEYDMKRFLVPVAILAALACSCSSGPDRANPTDRPTGTAPPVQLVAALQSTDSCEALLAWIKSEARTRVGPYGFSDGRMYAMEGDMAVDGVTRSSAGFAEDSAANTTMAPEPAAAPADVFTKTATT